MYYIYYWYGLFRDWEFRDELAKGQDKNINTVLGEDSTAADTRWSNNENLILQIQVPENTKSVNYCSSFHLEAVMELFLCSLTKAVAISRYFQSVSFVYLRNYSRGDLCVRGHPESCPYKDKPHINLEKLISTCSYAWDSLFCLITAAKTAY